MSVFAFDLYLSTQHLVHAPGAALMSVSEFVAHREHWRVMADLALLAFSAGLYSVPMYALIQLRAKPSHRARIIAANNILNALFMIVSSVLAGALLGAGFSIPEVFGATAVLNVLVVGYVFWLMPEYIIRLVMLVVTRIVYRLKVKGDEHLPTEGHDHDHGPTCGHVAVPHGDHVDYLHDGHRHAVHGSHYDEH